MAVFQTIKKNERHNMKMDLNKIFDLMRSEGTKITKTDLSTHLDILVDRGLISTRPYGKKSHTYRVHPGIEKLDSVLVITPLMLGELAHKLLDIFVDARAQQIIFEAKIPGKYKPNKKLLTWVRARLASLHFPDDVLVKICYLLETAYCTDRKSFIQNILDEKVAGVFRRREWWRQIRNTSRQYQAHQELRNQLTELLSADMTDEERERRIMALEIEMAEAFSDE